MRLEPVGRADKGPPARFTGDVYATSLSAPGDPARLAAGIVRFAPESRTNWHVHPWGQTLHILGGIALVGTRDGTVIRALPGETVQCDPGEEHWHGAAPDVVMAHLAMVVAPPGEEATEWLEPVTDEQYRRAAAEADGS